MCVQNCIKDMLVYCLGVLFLLLAVSTIADCKRTKKFYVVENKAVLTYAKDACENNGMELATIESEQEENFLESYLSKTHFDSNYGESFFLNARRVDDYSDEFEWKTDPPRKLNYTKWHQGEPNNLDQIEDCVVITKRGDSYGWSDLPCLYGRRFNFICMEIEDEVLFVEEIVEHLTESPLEPL